MLKSFVKVVQDSLFMLRFNALDVKEQGFLVARRFYRIEQ